MKVFEEDDSDPDNKLLAEEKRKSQQEKYIFVGLSALGLLSLVCYVMLY